MKCPSVVVRAHVRGHQCTSLAPALVARLGGRDVVCRQLCRVHLEPRVDDADNPHRGVVMWRGEQWWVELVVARVFDRRYRSIRHILIQRRGGKANTGGGIAKSACLAVAAVMARHANWETGQNCRVSNRTLCEETGLSLTQVGRVRLALLLMGVATEVLRGRQRTKVERMASWRVGDPGRGWASVWALHPPRGILSGDNSAPFCGSIPAGQTKMATHPFRGLSSERRETFSSTYVAPGCGKGASRSLDKSRAREPKALPDRNGFFLACRWLADERTPAWARRYSPYAWAEVLAPAGEHGWVASDLNDTLPAAADPRWPLAYVRTMLDRVDLAMPPSVIRRIDAELAAKAEREKREMQAKVDQALGEVAVELRASSRAEGAAAVGGAGHRLAREVLREIAEKPKTMGRQRPLYFQRRTAFGDDHN